MASGKKGSDWNRSWMENGRIHTRGGLPISRNYPSTSNLSRLDSRDDYLHGYLV